MTDLDQSTPGFQHRYTLNGKVESICLHCCLPVSTAYTLRDLTRAQIEHQCPEAGWSMFSGRFSSNAA
jgi:hypothetical protein